MGASLDSDPKEADLARDVAELADAITARNTRLRVAHERQLERERRRSDAAHPLTVERDV